MEVKNAKITNTMLGCEDHGILSAWLTLDYGGTGQGFGGYALDGKPKDRGERSPHAACGLWVKRILEVVGVGKWEDLKGQHVRVRTNGGKVYAIGHLLEDKWFEPEVELKRLKGDRDD